MNKCRSGLDMAKKIFCSVLPLAGLFSLGLPLLVAFASLIGAAVAKKNPQEPFAQQQM